MLSKLSQPAVFRLASLQAVFLGLFSSVYLLYVYISHRPIVCGGLGGCEIVRLSKWAYVFGTVPRPLLGVIFYGAVLLLLLLRVSLRSHAHVLWRAMQALVAIGVMESVWLFFVQWQEIGAFCLWCLLSALAAVELAVHAFFDRPVEDDPAHPEARSVELRYMLISMAVLSVIFFVGFWLLLRA